MAKIVSLSAKQIKFIRSLSLKKYRDEYNLFIVEGEKLVNEAINSNYTIKDIYKIEEIGEDCMKRISNLASPSPILAIIEKPNICSKTIINKALNYNKLSLALDEIKDPGNLGTIIRLADWFGIDYIFASEHTVEVYNSKTIQATMGAIFRKQVVYTPLEDLLIEYSKSNIPIYGTFLDGNNIYTQTLNNNALIVMGNESNGISKGIKNLVSHKLLIPPYPINSTSSESLNVAIATAIVCSCFRRLTP